MEINMNIKLKVLTWAIEKLENIKRKEAFRLDKLRVKTYTMCHDNIYSGLHLNLRRDKNAPDTTYPPRCASSNTQLDPKSLEIRLTEITEHEKGEYFKGYFDN